jgi:histone deacetylase HOS3
MERKPAITAASIAQEHFRKELDGHGNDGTPSKTVVILRDACYGHRFSRPRTSRAALSTIVERPERLHACVLGASAAYVRIGGRHAGGEYPPHPNRDITTMSPPPFKIRKTARAMPLNASAVTQVHGAKWMEELQIMCDSAEGKLAMNGRELVRPIGYGKDEAGNPLPKLHEGDLYLCSESLDALQGCLGGVCEAVDTVCGPGDIQRAFVCIRPPGHHCSSNFPSGFCWLNNVHVGIAHAAMTQGLTHAAVIDFDLHHGDGSQAIAWDRNRKATSNLPKNASPYSRTPIGYFSLHDVNSYPCEWGDEEKIKNASLCIENAHGQSIWNVHLEPWKNHTDFWRLYESRYSVLLEKTRNFLRHHTEKLNGVTHGPKAKATIFLSAGFDASEWEGAGMQRHNVNVPTDFYARFTSDVVKLAEEEGLGVDGRIISVLEGGYSDRALTSGVLSHLCGLTHDADHDTVKSEGVDQSLASAMAKQMGMLRVNGTSNGVKNNMAQRVESGITYHPDWWAAHHLEALEVLVNPLPAASAKKDKVGGNYSSPTQASTAKIAEPIRERRSLSAQLEGRLSAEPEPVPPPPDVDWAVAAYELSRLLIPPDRQTLSCRHDELNAEATKIRRERQSTIGLPTDDLPSTVDQRMQLRDRKAKAPTHNEDLAKVVSKANRRKTIASAGDLPDPGPLQDSGSRANDNIANGRPRRRSSAASSILSAFESMNLNSESRKPSLSNAVTGDGQNLVSQGDAASNLAQKPVKASVPKKTKPTAAIKTQPVKPKASPRKAGPAPPVPSIPSGFVPKTTVPTNEGANTNTNQRELSLNGSDSAKSASNVDELDAVSSSMKKMKTNLKVPSPEGKAARGEAAEEKEKEKLKKSRAPRKPVVPKAAKAPVTKKDVKPIDLTDISSAAPPNPLNQPLDEAKSEAEDAAATPVDFITPFIQQDQIIQPPHKAEQPPSGRDYVPVPAHAEPPLQRTIAAPITAPMQIDTTAPAAKPDPESSQSAPDLASIGQPPTSAATFASGLPSPPLPPQLQQPEVTAMPRPVVPASVPASTVKKTRADLPQFTASSPIPFAKQDPFGAVGSSTEQPWRSDDRTATEMKPPVASTSVAPDTSVWEVPETPGR